MPKTTASVVTPVNLPASVSLIRKTSNTPSTPQSSTKSATTTTPVNASSSANNSDRPKTFLRVKSLTALQNVPSECITIPDDPIPPPPPLTLIQNDGNSDVLRKSIEDNSETADVVEILDDIKEDVEKSNKESSLVNGVAEENLNNSNNVQQLTYDLKEPHSKELNRIMSHIKIVLDKSSTIDEMVEQMFKKSNDDMSD